MKKIKKVLILGGSSDIGIEVVKIFLKLDWEVVAHFSRNKKVLEKLKTKNKKLKIIKNNFYKYKNKNFEKLFKKVFSSEYNSFINLIGYTDNKSFYTTNLENIIKTLAINTIIPIIIQKLIIKRMLKNKWGRILNCSGIGVKYGGGKITLITPFHNIPGSLYLVFLKIGLKKMFSLTIYVLELQIQNYIKE